MLHCYLLQVFSCVEINLECQLYYRDDARISKLYDGLQCNEISMETGDFCNANRRCVMPSTPGDPESTCPNQAVRTIRRRKVEKRKKAKAKDSKVVNVGWEKDLNFLYIKIRSRFIRGKYICL